MTKKKNEPKIAMALMRLTITHTNEVIEAGQICDLSHLTPAEWKKLTVAGIIETAEGEPVNVYVKRPAQKKK